MSTIAPRPITIAILAMGGEGGGVLAEWIVDLAEHGGYIATRAMIEHGHTELAYISGPHWKVDSFRRLTGHQRALKEFGIPFDERLVYEGDFEEASGREAMSHLLDLGIPFTGVICANDEMAAGAMDTARKQGLKLPEELSEIGRAHV